jgi:hypothetical protein
MSMVWLSRIGWSLRQMMHRLGWAGLGGLVLMALASAFHTFALPLLASNADALRDNTHRARRQLVENRNLMNATDPGAQLTTFYEFFPDDDEIANVLERLYAAAGKNNLSLDQGEYRLVPVAGSQLVRYDMTLPVTGQYPKIRDFLALALIENPTLAVESVSFSRRKAMDIGIEAQIRMTLYLKAAP